jgi:hypothetical protein
LRTSRTPGAVGAAVALVLLVLAPGGP